MNNACIVWNNGNTAFRASEYTSIVDVFRSLGYPVGEVRILLHGDDQILLDTVLSLKKSCENLLILTDQVEHAYVQKLLSQKGVFNEKNANVSMDGNGIFTDGKQSTFLLTMGDFMRTKQYIERVCGGHLRQKYGDRRAKLTIRAVGANQAHVEQLILQAKTYDKGKMQYQYARSYAEDVIEIFYDENTPKMLVDDVLRLFAEGLGDSVYALDDTPLSEQLINLLKVRGKTVSVAESFTGGGIAKKLTSVSGASAVYFEGVNTYNERSKIKRLGVSEYTLKTVGAVSDQTAYEMASGLIATGDCDIAIATTGLAGPNTDKSMLPVGLCYIAVGTKERVFVYRYKFDGSREEITQTAINYALFLAYKQLKNM